MYIILHVELGHMFFLSPYFHKIHTKKMRSKFLRQSTPMIRFNLTADVFVRRKKNTRTRDDCFETPNSVCVCAVPKKMKITRREWKALQRYLSTFSVFCRCFWQKLCSKLSFACTRAIGHLTVLFFVEPIFFPASFSFRLISVRPWWLACWINRIPARNASLFFRFFLLTLFFYVEQ